MGAPQSPSKVGSFGSRWRSSGRVCQAVGALRVALRGGVGARTATVIMAPRAMAARVRKMNSQGLSQGSFGCVSVMGLVTPPVVVPDPPKTDTFWILGKLSNDFVVGYSRWSLFGCGFGPVEHDGVVGGGVFGIVGPYGRGPILWVCGNPEF